MFDHNSYPHRHTLRDRPSASNLGCHPVKKSGATEMTVSSKAQQTTCRYLARRYFEPQGQATEMKYFSQINSHYRFITDMLMPSNPETSNAIRAYRLRTSSKYWSQV